VAQILAASTFPTEVVEVGTMDAGTPNLTETALGRAGGPATLGCQREGAHPIPRRASEHEPEPVLDLALGDALHAPAGAVLEAIQVMRRRRNRRET